MFARFRGFSLSVQQLHSFSCGSGQWVLCLQKIKRILCEWHFIEEKKNSFFVYYSNCHQKTGKLCNILVRMSKLAEMPFKATKDHFLRIGEHDETVGSTLAQHKQSPKISDRISSNSIFSSSYLKLFVIAYCFISLSIVNQSIRYNIH